MNPWRAGDGIGQGKTYLPDTKTKKAYASECQRQLIDATAHQVADMQSLEARRRFLDKCPISMREAIKARIREIWK